MKSYNNLYEPMLESSYIRKCFTDAAKGKSKRNDVEEVMSNLDEEIEKLKSILREESFRPAKHEKCVINENNCHKTREIIKPDYKYEQVIHHCLIGQFKKIVMNGLYEFSCGSIPGRGVHYGKRYMKKWLSSYEGKKIFVLKMDVHHFFESVDHDILKQMLAKVIRDKRFLNLLYIIIDANEKGLPLGYFTSQWLANFYLKAFDHYVKEELKAEHYIRYMDDMVILGKNKKKLRKMREVIQTYLRNNLKLELKYDWQVFRFEYTAKDGKTRGRFIDFMGFCFHENRITMRKTILQRARRKALKIAKKERITWYDATAMLSYMGWFTHTDTYAYYEHYIKLNVNVRKLKRIVSKHQRKENQRERVEETNGNTGGTSGRSGQRIISDNCIPAAGY